MPAFAVGINDGDDWVIVNAQVIRPNPAPPATAMWVRGESIMMVGQDQEVLQAAKTAAAVWDVEGRTVIPGLTDVHTHVARHALEVNTVECRDLVDPAVDSVAVILERLAKAAKEAKRDDWVIGTGAMRQQIRLAEGRWPTRQELDRAVPDNPAYVSFGAHVVVANTMALRRGGVSSATPDPFGGRIVRDSGTGEPTGLLLEHAQKWIKQDLPARYSFAELVVALERSLRKCAARGVTCIHDIVDSPSYVRAYQELWRSGRLPIRVSLLLRVLNSDFDGSALAGLGLNAGFGDDWLWFGGGKISIDGGFTGRTAAFKAKIDGHPLCESILRVERSQLQQMVERCQRAGLRLCIHAIGDLAVDEALDSFEKAGATGSRLRHRLEHFGNWLCTPNRLARCKKLGVTPVPNPPFLYYLGNDAWNLLGGEENYARSAFPFQSLLRSGFRYAGGSDGPGYYPIDGPRDLATFLSRESFDGRAFKAGEELGFDDALRAQTENAAWLGYRESSLGSLEQGYRADFVVMDGRDPGLRQPETLREMGIYRVVVGGRQVKCDSAYA